MKYRLSIMTTLGLFFAKRLINRSELSRKTGIKVSRLTVLSTKENSRLFAFELHLIALALDMTTQELDDILFGDIKLP